MPVRGGYTSSDVDRVTPSHPIHSDHSSLLYDTWALVLGQPQVQVGIECITEGEHRAREDSGEPATEMDGCGGHNQARLLPRRMADASGFALEELAFPLLTFTYPRRLRVLICR